MAVVVIDKKSYVIDNELQIDSVILLNNSFIIDINGVSYGYASNNDEIIPLIGIKTQETSSAIQLNYKGKKFALLFDDINLDADSEFSLNDFLENKLFINFQED